MTTDAFKTAVQAAASRPKGVLVSLNLFRALDAEKAIERKLGTPWGLPVPSLGVELPYYDGDIYVAFEPMLDGFDFKLPPG